MRKLLSAGFVRLFKAKSLWLGTALIFAMSVMVMLNEVRHVSDMEQAGYSYTAALDSCYYFVSPILGLFAAIFISLFIGTEYSDGTIRNKLMVGHTRTDIYLAHFIVCLAAGLFFIAAWLIGGLVGIPYLGLWQMGIQSVILYSLVAVFFIISFTGIYTLLCTLSTNKAVTAVAAIVIWLVLFLLSSKFYSDLSEPATVSDFMMTADGMQIGDPAPNPNYVGGSMRTLYYWILDILPTGQGILMAGTDISHPLRNIICSAAIALCTTICGILAFGKKDLK